MFTTYITSEEKLKEAVAEAVDEILDEELPSIIRKSKRGEYMTTKELKKLTGWSYRTQNKLRRKRLIDHSVHGRKIVYPTKSVYKFVRNHQIDSVTGNS